MFVFKCTQTVKLKPSKTLFANTKSNPTLFSFIKKYWSNLMTFKIKINQFYGLGELKQ